MHLPLDEQSDFDGFVGLRLGLFYSLSRLAFVPGLVDARRPWARLGASVVVFWEEGDTVLQENGLDPSRIALAPKSSLGPAGRSRGEYIGRRFGVSSRTTTLICAGTLADWSMSDGLVHSAGDWRDDLALVMRSRMATGSEEVCLMEFSSGKRAAYLPHGLPVIVSDTDGPCDLVRTYECGVMWTLPKRSRRQQERSFDATSGSARMRCSASTNSCASKVPSDACRRGFLS